MAFHNMRCLLVLISGVGLYAADIRESLLDQQRLAQAWIPLAEARGLSVGPPLWARRDGGPDGAVLVLTDAHEQTTRWAKADGTAEEGELWPDVDLGGLPTDQRLMLPEADALAYGQELWSVEADGGIRALEWASHGSVIDLDGDGSWEVVTRTNEVIKGQFRATELRVRRTGSGAPDLLRLMCGSGTGAWTFTTQHDAQGWRLLIGPEQGRLLHAVATVTWDGQQRRCRWPANPAISELPAQADEAARTAAIAALPSTPLPPLPDLDDRIAAALGHPYRATSLITLDAAALQAWMGPGRGWAELAQRSLAHFQVPEDCWTLPPGQAALRLATANRTRSFNRSHPLTVATATDAPDGDLLLSTWCRAHGRGDDCQQGLMILHVAPTGSCLLRLNRWRSYAAQAQGLESDHRHYAALIDLDTALARQTLGVLRCILSLQPATSEKGDFEHRGHSTADSAGELILRGPPGQRSLSGTCWADAGFRWAGAWDDEARLNLGVLWLQHGLIPRLGAAWPGYGADARRSVEARAILARAVSGALPVEIRLPAARLLAEQDWSALPELLAPLTTLEPGLQIALEQAKRRTQATADPQAMRQLARSAGPEQIWALQRILAADPAAGLAELAERSRDEPDVQRRQGFVTWLGNRTQEDEVSVPTAASQPAPAPEAPEPATSLAMPLLADPEADPFKRWDEVRHLSTLTRRRPLHLDEAALLHRVLTERKDWRLAHLQCAVIKLLIELNLPLSRGELLDALAFGTTAFDLEPVLQRAVTQLATTAEDRAALCARLAGLLADRSIAIDPLLWAAWRADLRELRPAMAAVATGSADDPEGPRRTSTGGSPRPNAGRYHLARQILSCWDEPDPATRARLLTLFALGRGLDPQSLARNLAGCGGARQAALPLIDAAGLEAERVAAWRRVLDP